jgi:IS605 OrfB family transposase
MKNSKLEGTLINAQSVQYVIEENFLRYKHTKKNPKFRDKDKLGWVPFKQEGIKFCGNYVIYFGKKFRFWNHRPLPKEAIIKVGSFAEDAQGRWYLNLTIQIPEHLYKLPLAPNADVGVDPGLKTILTLSNGDKYERENFTKKYSVALTRAQRHRKKRQVKKIHAKIKNCRLDWAHKASNDLAKKYQTIYFGDVKASKMKKTRLAKSVSDVGWYQVSNFLHYKAVRHGGIMLKTSEKFSTVTCSSCLSRTGPSGLSGLSIRVWTCEVCKSVHDRDVNSALNILRSGRGTLRDVPCRHIPREAPAIALCA